ncbi:MAG TPA: xanthine dehydrogenase family protein molybdopterin-binding subunit [Thermodesulfovibrionales bacterium]|nr:xanthine dehydrogenase family protein molybdopterin-binding subunit [Thermodesulfovibrionales bacterium]
MNGMLNMSRRDFLKTGAMIGGGLILGFRLPAGTTPAEAATQTQAAAIPNAFIRISPDNTITLLINKSEMGQGVYTSLPMLIAEELECDWNKIKVESAPVDPVYNHTAYGMQMTGGSSSVWSEYDRLREVGAACREMLIAAAAQTWKVPRASCRAKKGAVVHSGRKRLTYGQLADEAAKLPVPAQVALKKPSAFTIIGKPTKRLDTPEKVNGTAVFGIDAKVPGMLMAVIARPPVFGGKAKGFNAEKTKAVKGVSDVVQIDSGVAVVADSFWSAQRGRDALEITWDEGPNVSLSTTEMRTQFAELAKTPGKIARKDGEAVQAFTKAAKRISAEYEVPYLAHACMEPLNCLVDLRADSCEIWTGTQFQTVDRNAAAAIAGLKPEQIKIHTTFLGGGFGRRANPHSDFVVEAVKVAKEVKKPVKVVWTREDDMKGGYYRPMWYDRLEAALDEKGKPVAWQHTIVGQSIIGGTPFESAMVKDGIDQTSVEGAKEIPYAIPNILVDLHSPKIGVPVQWWRSVGHSHTCFVVESFMDELAHAAGRDPYEFRRGLLAKSPRNLRVLDLVARKAHWGAPLPKGRSRGIAVHESFGSFVAQVAEVTVDPAGKVRVHRVVCAVDCGNFVNPETIRAQMESGVVFGLSAGLYGAITLKEGKVEQSNFNDYQMLRLLEMPEVEVHIVQGKEKPGGIGEPGVPPIAPAVCNAIFALTGTRIRSLPIRAEELKKA